MAVPKGKTSKSRKNNRKASWKKIASPNFSECSNCGESKLPHQACSNCGYYNGRKVLDIKEE